MPGEARIIGKIINNNQTRKQMRVLLLLLQQNNLMLGFDDIFQILGIIIVKVEFLSIRLLDFHHVLLVFFNSLPGLVHINGRAEDVDTFKTTPVDFKYQVAQQYGFASTTRCKQNPRRGSFGTVECPDCFLVKSFTEIGVMFKSDAFTIIK